jgi:hypothetical protein
LSSKQQTPCNLDRKGKEEQLIVKIATFEIVILARREFYKHNNSQVKDNEEMSEQEFTPPPSMLWPSNVGQEAFVDFSRSPSRTGARLEGDGNPSPEHKIKSEKEKNNKVDHNNNKGDLNKGDVNTVDPESHPSDSPDKDTSMKDMKERLKMKTGVFKKHLTDLFTDSNATSTVFDMEDNNKCIVWDDKGRIKHATLPKIVEKLTSEKHTGMSLLLKIYVMFI